MSITDSELERRMVFAREQAAQAWCDDDTSGKVMDTELCEAFARRLVKVMYAPHLGCASTRELLVELGARVDLDYKTVSDGE